MSKLVHSTTARLIIPILIGAVLLLSGCATPKGEGLAIYLTKEDIPPAQMPALSHIDTEAAPIISMEDIITYNAQTHELGLTASAFGRIVQLDVPVRGRTFIVCVDRKPIYWGAFWTPISSMSFDGVTIWKPFGSEGPNVVTLELGYPSPSFYGGEDPRNRPEVLKALKQAGKLVTNLSIAAVDKLPRSMKGYELYSWSQDGQWHFTLITGTNRNKTVEEIVSGEDFISQAGWVNIHVVGVDALNAVLDKLPQGESVFWLAQPRSEQTNINFTLPPEPSIEVIKEHAGQCGLDLTLPLP